LPVDVVVDILFTATENTVEIFTLLVRLTVSCVQLVGLLFYRKKI